MQICPSSRIRPKPSPAARHFVSPQQGQGVLQLPALYAASLHVCVQRSPGNTTLEPSSTMDFQETEILSWS